ncbi:MAG: VCBS domain-containing protein, partial [Sedimenticola sp.]
KATVSRISPISCSLNTRPHCTQSTGASLSIDAGDVGTLTFDYVDVNTGTIGWTYNVEDRDVDFLSEGDKLTVIYNVTVNDDSDPGGTRSDDSSVIKEVKVVITGTNDRPVIDSAASSLTDDTVVVQTIPTPGDDIMREGSGQIAFTDVDSADINSASAVLVSAMRTGSIKLDVSGNGGVDGLIFGDVEEDAGTVDWTYTIGDAVLSALGGGPFVGGDTLTVIYNVTVNDNSDPGGTRSDDSSVIKEIKVVITGEDKTIHGTTGDDSFDGTALVDHLYGWAGDDTLNGLAGDDLIFGGTGDDLISGGAGDDLIFGGAGNDTLNGDSDADTFHYEDMDEGLDTILGLEGVDTINLDKLFDSLGLSATDRTTLLGDSVGGPAVNVAGGTVSGSWETTTAADPTGADDLRLSITDNVAGKTVSITFDDWGAASRDALVDLIISDES